MADEQAQPHALTTVRSTAIDGRMHNVYWRQDQLRSLHTTLVSTESAALDAIVQDSQNTLAEAKIEFYLALAAVKQHFLSLDPAKELEREYRLAHAKDDADRLEPVGIVYIEPATEHTLLYSVIAPLASAIAAGNCVVVQLDPTPATHLPTYLTHTLHTALDPDIYALPPTRPPTPFLASPTVLSLLQTGPDDTLPRAAKTLASAPSALSLAIVDRTADIPAAARALVAARFAFNGRSPFAPDLVLVDEFAKEAFLVAASGEMIRFSAAAAAKETGVVAANGAADGKPKAEDSAAAAAADALKSTPGVRVVTAGANGGILDITRRDSPALTTKPPALPYLLTHATTSLDAAIDLATALSSPTAAILTIYADAPSAKYLAHAVPALAAFANHFPRHLLVGPAPAPDAPVPLDPADRFPVGLFAVARPLWAGPRGVLRGEEGGEEEVRRLGEEARAGVGGKRAYERGTGFFEQGVLLGLGMVGVPVLVGVGAGVWWGVRRVLRGW